jgi:hypothetical protein
LFLIGFGGGVQHAGGGGGVKGISFVFNGCQWWVTIRGGRCSKELPWFLKGFGGGP